MAFAARLAPLTEELVQALTQLSPQADSKRFSATRDTALRALKSHSYLRTNQFDVERNLDGLEERFRVNHRDGLADALRQRREALSQHPSDWHPEILSLLLELSDQPTFKTRLSDVEALGQDVQDASVRLRWEDLAKEDGWDQDADLWKTINYSDDSDDEEYEEESSEESDATTIPNSSEPVGRLAQDFIIHPEDKAALEAVQRAQAWRTTTSPDPVGQSRKVATSESQVVREVLFMLQGLDSTLFDRKGSAVTAFQLTNLAWETHRALMNTFSTYGRQLRILRAFASRPERVPHLQALQDCISRRLQVLDGKLSEIQVRLASPTDEVIISLIAIRSELLPWLEPLFVLSNIIAQVQDGSRAETFRYLELMFDEAGIAQLTGKLDTYRFLAEVFVECFNVYLRPIRQWMDQGTLLPGNEVFFITEPASDVSMCDTWQDRFELRKLTDGSLHAPKFLKPAVSRIYNAGKNIVVLRLLGKQSAVLSPQTEAEPPLDYSAICPPGFELAPFADMFGAAFNRWIQSKYRKTSTTLKNALFNDWGLGSSLDALQALFLMSDGAAAGSFCENLFGRMDAATAWHDRYGLTAAGSEAFASLVDINRLTISVDAAGRQISVKQATQSVKHSLPHVQIGYKLPWPVQMIVTRDSIGHYQAVFTFLLQIKRALHVLHAPKILDNLQTDGQRWDERALFYSSRNKLLWFCTTLQTYLATLVLEPVWRKMRLDLQAADDMDGMIAVHAGAMKQVVDEACLGSRLAPIHAAVLDVLDLALMLEDGRRSQQAGAASVSSQPGGEVAHRAALQKISAEFDRSLRFITGGLRSVARASSTAQSAKWDTLADMLHTGELADGRA
ncbi:gamma-tubulin complex component GCP5 [Purpureocillium lilacinum]|uniref:Spindle pole body component n=1 Tax=Purpureocillium lilacinum TaxID=33203 RepID=A0A179H783_PURLI|nr:gamma-tubulin complex component GCP5 [Purpureocillium lilacinum]OAQ85421.1 gamma-tubulin complex component GCP5 [Purpureocillium lilacinum]